MTTVRVLVASSEQLTQAGVRIRYKRLEPYLAQMGFDLTVSAIDEFADPSTLRDDIYLLSKCYDVRSQILTRHIKDRGKIIGVDLFDDYFSQAKDSRLVRYRVWLERNLEFADFVLTSTPAMRENISRYTGTLPVQIIDDPSVPIDAQRLADAVRQKIDAAQEDRVLNLTWFGIGDNPRFPVGLRDLAAFSDQLLPFRDCGFDVKLSVLTNRRAMTTDALSALKRLPVPYTVNEWSERAQDDLLASSHACFIPVNAQRFSIVKSLNRAVSGLASATQVLSAGYPLYAPLSDFVYRDAGQLVADMASGMPLLRPDSISALVGTLQKHASAEREAEELGQFFKSVLDQKGKSAPEGHSLPDALSEGNKTGGPSKIARKAKAIALATPFSTSKLSRILPGWLGRKKRPAAGRTYRHGVIHGRESADRFHKFAHKADTLSIASPFRESKADYDVRFAVDERSGELIVYVAKDTIESVAAEYRSLFTPHGRIYKVPYLALPVSRLMPAGIHPAKGETFVWLMDYQNCMAEVEAVLQKLFPEIHCIVSEHSKLPFYYESDASEVSTEVA